QRVHCAHGGSALSIRHGAGARVCRHASRRYRGLDGHRDFRRAHDLYELARSLARSPDNTEHLMFRILHDTSYDFIRWWKVMAAITIAFILLGLGSLAIKPPNYSIEFTGGTLMQLQFAQPPDVGAIRQALDDAGIRGAEIQQFGSNRDFTLRAQNPSQVAAQARGAENIAVTIEAVLKKKFGENSFKVGRTEAVGPRVGQELKRGAIIAILLSFLITLIYLSIRFEWRFATAAVIATSHDVFTTIAFLKLMHLEISLTVVAGLLTVLGYSLNDTIIIFDRVRENLRKGRRETLYETVTRSI